MNKTLQTQKKEGEFLTVSQLQTECFITDSATNEFIHAHPKQIINNMLDIPVWKILYKYVTKRGNTKQAIKFVILDEHSWDLVDTEFKNHIKENNEQHPERAISNVEILDITFLGKVFLNLE